jgi:hypothetical protein
VEWSVLLFGLLYTIVYLLFVGDPTNRDDIGIIFVPAVTLPFVFWCSMRLAKHGLALWAEGFGPSVEFCKNGVAVRNTLHGWESPTLHDIRWTAAGAEIVVSSNHHMMTVLTHNIMRFLSRQGIPIPAHQFVTVSVSAYQREGVEAILEHYYRPQRSAAGAPEPQGPQPASSEEGVGAVC